jgi:riboflavin synthase
MFTGIITDRGTVSAIRQNKGGARLRISRRGRKTLRRGDSIAVDGVCLTVVSNRNGSFDADVSPETLSRTILGSLKRGAKVNLERPLRLSDPLGGHLVQGHVDTIGHVESVRDVGEFVTCRFSYPQEFGDFIIAKGSVAVNGVSLTIVDPEPGSFAAALIPETLKRTNLGQLQRGHAVNLEFDVIAKFVSRLAHPYLKS